VINDGIEKQLHIQGGFMAVFYRFDDFIAHAAGFVIKHILKALQFGYRIKVVTLV